MDATIMLLRLAASLVMITFSISQFSDPEAWFHYVPNWMRKPAQANFVPAAGPVSAIRFHAAISLFVAIWLLIGLFPLVAAWTAFVWWLCILPFTYMSRWQSGVRDTALSLAILALIFLLSP